MARLYLSRRSTYITPVRGNGCELSVEVIDRNGTCLIQAPSSSTLGLPVGSNLCMVRCNAWLAIPLTFHSSVKQTSTYGLVLLAHWQSSTQ